MELIQSIGVEAGEGEIERIGLDNDFGEAVHPKVIQGKAPRIADAIDLPLGVVAVLLDPLTRDEPLGGEPLDCPIDGTRGEVSPQVNVFLLCKEQQPMAVHRTSFVERAQDEETDG